MIEIKDVSKSFGRVEALKHVSLTIRADERVAFVGSNGAGKTTLHRAVLGLARYSGRTTVHGLDVARDPLRALARVAYIPQVAPPIEASAARACPCATLALGAVHRSGLRARLRRFRVARLA